jgi:carbonic anhydrase/acetyltransferase-like protein (isoleucine patch superfamily)
MKKYELIDRNPVTGLYRIRALRDIPSRGVRIGSYGGLVEGEQNLSHDGDCWISRNAEVYNNAKVKDNARVYENAKVYGAAVIRDNAIVGGYARVYGSSRVFDAAQIYGHARIYDYAMVYRNAQVYGDAEVCAMAEVLGQARIWGNAKIRGNAIVKGKAEIRENAIICTSRQHLVVGPIGSRDDFTTFYASKSDVYVCCGCFNDTLENFEQAVLEEHNDDIHGIEYKQAIETAKIRFRCRSPHA